jgi:nucleoside-diphosphate-sugar epimerase
MDYIISTDIDEILNNVKLDCLKAKTILITGASGMLGMYILFSLYVFNKRNNSGMRIIAVIYRDLPQHLAELKGCDFINFIQGDLSDIDFCSRLQPADVIFHAACYAQPARFMEESGKTVKLNTLTTALLLEKLLNGGSFLFFSSVGVYVGYNDKADETADIFNLKKDDDPRECYYRSKKAGEYICNTYSLTEGKDIKIVRIVHTYGPGTRSDDKKVLNDFILKAQTGKIQMRDRGVDLQHYTYITDMVKMLFKSFLYGKKRLYNIGNPARVSIAEVAHTVGAIMNAKVIIPSDCGPGSQVTAFIDVSRFMNEFPDTTFVSLNEGIKRTIEWKRLMGRA